MKIRDTIESDLCRNLWCLAIREKIGEPRSPTAFMILPSMILRFLQDNLELVGVETL